jgi:hypothetical protein
MGRQPRPQRTKPCSVPADARVRVADGQVREGTADLAHAVENDGRRDPRAPPQADLRAADDGLDGVRVRLRQVDGVAAESRARSTAGDAPVTGGPNTPRRAARSPT